MGKKNKAKNTRRQQTKLQKQKRREIKKKRQVQAPKSPVATHPGNMTAQQSEEFFKSLSPELAEGLRAMDEDAETELAERRTADGDFKMDPLPRRTGPRPRRGRPRGVKNGQGRGGKRTGIRRRPLLMDLQPNEKGEFHPSLYLTSRYLSFKRHMERVNAEVGQLDSWGFEDLTSRATRVFMYRMYERKLTGELYPWQQQFLSDSGFNWVAPPRIRKEQEFEEILKGVSAIKERDEHGRIIVEKIPDPELKKTIKAKIKAYDKGELSATLAKQLLEVGVPLPVQNAHTRWLETFERFKVYQKEGTKDAKEDRRWRTWMKNQRDQKTAGKLAEERIRLLNEVGFDWNPPRRRRLTFEQKVDRLINTARQDDGSFDYASLRKSFVPLISEIRKQHRKGTLPAKLSEKLKAANFALDGFFTESAMVERWREKLALYVKLRGPKSKKRLSSKVLSKHSLLSWANRQRNHYEAGKLPDYWVEELKAVNFPLTEKKRVRRSLDEWRESLEEYRKREGLTIPRSIGGDLRLRIWILRQRDLWNNGTIDPEAAKLLESCGFTKEVLNAAKTRRDA